MSDIQQQIADGARPLARVGDVIEHGQDIPANVVVMADADMRQWKHTRAGHWHGAEDAIEACETSECYEDSTWKMKRRYPLSVVEVDPEPQADPAPSGLCEVGPDRIRCVITDPDHRRIYHLGRPYDADGHLPLKGTATGDNQLDVPQPASRTVRVTMALDIQDRDGRAVISTYEGEIGSCDRQLFLDTVAETFGVRVVADDEDALYLARKSRDEHRNRLEAITGWFIRDGHAEPDTQLTNITGPVHALSEKYRTKQTGAGPVVLSLPQVPDGTVALVTEDGTRFVPHGNQGGHSWWHSDSRGTFSLARILSELGSVTVEFAPPREARVWEQLDPGTDDLQVVECLGMRYTRGSDSLWHGDRTSRTWLQLRALGEVREVLT